jgi:hypothetical protein
VLQLLSVGSANMGSSETYFTSLTLLLWTNNPIILILNIITTTMIPITELIWAIPQHSQVRTISNPLEVLEDTEVVSQVSSQNDVSHKIQHALIVLISTQSYSMYEEPCDQRLKCCKEFGMRSQTRWLMFNTVTHPPRKFFEDVAAVGVQNGNSLGKVVPLNEIITR